MFRLRDLSLSWRSYADIYARVFVVAMTQTFMHFIHYHRTEEYMEYLNSTDVEEQKASTAYLSMTETDFFALDSKDGRRNAVCNLLGLVNFWAQEGGDDTGGADIDGDGDGDDAGYEENDGWEISDSEGCSEIDLDDRGDDADGDNMDYEENEPLEIKDSEWGSEIELDDESPSHPAPQAERFSHVEIPRQSSPESSDGSVYQPDSQDSE